VLESNCYNLKAVKDMNTLHPHPQDAPSRQVVANRLAGVLFGEPMKKCFKCLEEKPIEQFYVHPRMADGHLGKCKECTKNDVNARYNDPAAKERIAKYERERSKRPERRANRMVYIKTSRVVNKEKWIARVKVMRAIKANKLIRLPCAVCGDPKSQAHHDDYSKPLDVRWLCFYHHRKEHGQNPKEPKSTPANMDPPPF
jgi:hypothetical protein